MPAEATAAHPLPILIFDLDGTILSVNSFKLWVRYLLEGDFPAMSASRRWGIRLQTLAIMLRRKILRCGHEVTKARLQQVWGDAIAISPQARMGLVTKLLATIRPNLKPLLAEITAGQRDAVLATAASGDYALALSAALGFQHSLATPSLACFLDSTAPQASQNVGTTKRDRTLHFLQEQGWQQRPRIFFTDHHEDLPLMAVSDKIIWLGEAADLPAVQTALANKPIITARSLTASEVLTLMDAI